MPLSFSIRCRQKGKAMKIEPIKISFARAHKKHKGQQNIAKPIKDNSQNKPMKDFDNYLKSEERQKEASRNALNNPKFIELSKQIEEELKNQTYEPSPVDINFFKAFISDMKLAIEAMKK